MKKKIKNRPATAKKRMKTRKTLLLALMPALLMPAKADIIPSPVSAPNLRPLEPTSVQMVSESVSVELYPDSSTVEALFEMMNPGETETVEVGFPIMDFYFGWKTSLFINQTTAGERFQVWVDDEPLHEIKIYGFDIRKVNQEHNLAAWKEDILHESPDREAPEENPEKNTSPRDSSAGATGRIAGIIARQGDLRGALDKQPWYLWNTTFPQGATRRIKVRYTLPRGISRRISFFNYLLHTGAGWNRTIGKATVQIRIHDIPDDQIQHIKPSGYTKEGNLIRWTFSDFEPEHKDDIYVYYNPQEPPQQGGNKSAITYIDNREESLNKIDVDDVACFSVVKHDTLNYPNGAVFVYSKTFYFLSVKELVRHHDPALFKELSTLDAIAFFESYTLRIEGCDFRDLLSPQTEVKKITAMPGDAGKTVLVIQSERKT